MTSSIYSAHPQSVCEHKMLDILWEGDSESILCYTIEAVATPTGGIDTLCYLTKQNIDDILDIMRPVVQAMFEDRPLITRDLFTGLSAGLSRSALKTYLNDNPYPVTTWDKVKDLLLPKIKTFPAGSIESHYFNILEGLVVLNKAKEQIASIGVICYNIIT